MDIRLEKLKGKKVKHIEVDYDDMNGEIHIEYIKFNDGTVLNLYGKADNTYYTIYKE